jgi:uncharacterized membrane protein (UPF0127 family)
VKSFLSPLLQPQPGPLMLVAGAAATPLARRIETAFDSAARNRGLLGRTHLDSGSALIIAPCWSVHTFFMRFTIDVIFAGRDGQVISVRSRLRPWRLAAGWGAYATIELPEGTVAHTEVRPGDVLSLVPVR